jgi:hypothetical protein
VGPSAMGPTGQPKALGGFHTHAARRRLGEHDARSGWGAGQARAQAARGASWRGVLQWAKKGEGPSVLAGREGLPGFYLFLFIFYILYILFYSIFQAQSTFPKSKNAHQAHHQTKIAMLRHDATFHNFLRVLFIHAII